MSRASTSDRYAPGPLRLVQEFLNTPAVEPPEENARIARAIRSAQRRGASQAALAARYGVSQRLVSAILRSDRGSGAPALGSADSTRRWLIARGVLGSREALSAREHRRILELRRVLLALALANNGEAAPSDALAALDRLARRVRLRVTFDSRMGQAGLAPAGAGADLFIGTVLAAVYDAMRDGSWLRVKACPAERCQHVFYDTSRNRTSTWCSMAVCGNRAKVRKYQQLRRSERNQ